MDLTEDCISVQGIFLSIEKNTLQKIKYRGGNEEIIDETVRKLHKFLTSQNYIKDGNINEAFAEKMKHIVTFLILNTELKIPLDEPGFQHLIGIMPKLSTCVLANIIIGLDLCKIYCDALLRFPLNITEQLLVEMLPCLKRLKPKTNVKNAHLFLQLIITKIVGALDNSDKAFDDVEKITDLASQVLLSLGGFHGEQMKNIKIETVHELMGYNLLNLLDLLLMCRVSYGTSKIIEQLLRTCQSIMMATTVDVFLSWAEIDYNDHVLQVSIAEKAYICIEKYKDYKPAKKLISLFRPMAQKPKTLEEQILCADISSTISMINKADSNQKHWFTSLLNSQVFNCEESMKCVEKWAHLCTLGDVTRILSMAGRAKNPKANKLAVKCASALPLDDLILAITRHFHESGLVNLKDNVQPELIVLFNKIKDKSIEEKSSKSLNLLLLKNPEQTIQFVFSECLKSSFYCLNVKHVLPSIKEIARIDGIGLKILKSVIASNQPSEHNCKNYTELLTVLIEVDFYTTGNILILILLPIMQNSLKEQNYETINFTLEIINNLQSELLLKEATEPFYVFIFDLLKCRCNFFSFNVLKQGIVTGAINLIEKLSQTKTKLYYTDHKIKEENDIFVTFYKQKLYSQEDINVLEYFSLSNLENHAETVAHLIKILPRCVKSEWILITEQLLAEGGIEKTIELLSDFIILICDLVDSQATKTEDVKTMLDALKYCLQNFGIAVKECIQPKIKNLDENIAATRNICRLLRCIPEDILNEEGFSLTNLLSDSSLKALRRDKKFACVVVSIKESRIRQILAQKILS